MSPGLKQALASPRARAVARSPLARDPMLSPVHTSARASANTPGSSTRGGVGGFGGGFGGGAVGSDSARARASATAALLSSPQLIRALVPLGDPPQQLAC